MSASLSIGGFLSRCVVSFDVEDDPHFVTPWGPERPLGRFAHIQIAAPQLN